MSKTNTGFNRFLPFIFGVDAETRRPVVLHNRFPRFFAMVEPCPKESGAASSLTVTEGRKITYCYTNPACGIRFEQMQLFDSYSADNPPPLLLAQEKADEFARLIDSMGGISRWEVEGGKQHD